MNEEKMDRMSVACLTAGIMAERNYYKKIGFYEIKEALNCHKYQDGDLKKAIPKKYYDALEKVREEYLQKLEELANRVLDENI